jgi:hypothetical protein
MNSPDVVCALTPVVEAFEQLGISYYIGGSVASSAQGIARATLDVDLVADLRLTQVPKLVSLLEKDYYIDEDVVHEAVCRCAWFNLIHLATMLKVDVFILKTRSYDQEAFQRSHKDRLQTSPDAREFYLASPEDVILNKLEWYHQGGEVSERQWADVLGVLKVQEKTLDLEYLQHWAQELGVFGLLQRALQDAGTTA